MKRRGSQPQKSQRGQGSTELMLLIAVVVIALSSAAYTFVPTLQHGVEELASDVQKLLDTQRVTISMDLINHTAHDEKPTAKVEEDDDGLFRWRDDDLFIRHQSTMLVDRDYQPPRQACTERGNC